MLNRLRPGIGKLSGDEAKLSAEGGLQSSLFMGSAGSGRWVDGKESGGGNQGTSEEPDCAQLAGWPPRGHDTIPARNLTTLSACSPPRSRLAHSSMTRGRAFKYLACWYVAATPLRA